MIKYLRIFRVSFRSSAGIRCGLPDGARIIIASARSSPWSASDRRQSGDQGRFDSMGTNLLIVRPGSINQAGPAGLRLPQHSEARRRRSIDRECPSVQATSPNVNTRQQVINGNKNWQTRSRAQRHVSPRHRWEMSRRLLRRGPGPEHAKVVVLGEEVRRICSRR